MKKSLLIGLMVTGLLFSGCDNKTTIDESAMEVRQYIPGLSPLANALLAKILFGEVPVTRTSID